MNLIAKSIKKQSEFSHFLEAYRAEKTKFNTYPLAINGLCEGAFIAFLACFVAENDSKRPNLIIVPDEKNAYKIKEELESLSFTCRVFPYREFLFHNIVSSHEFERERILTLDAIMNECVDFILATPVSALQYTLPKCHLSSLKKRISTSDTISLENLAQILAFSGYSRVDMVDNIGQYSIRGGIIDIYPPTEKNPIRCEFFGDEIDSMGYFDIVTQRRVENTDAFEILPIREILVNEEIKESLKEIIKSALKKADGDAKKILLAEIEAIDGNLSLNFIDKYFSAIYPSLECLLDYFSENAVFVWDISACLSNLRGSFSSLNEETVSMLKRGEILSKYSHFSKDEEFLISFCEKSIAVFLSNFAVKYNGKTSGTFNFRTAQGASLFNNFDALCEDISGYRKSNYEIIILTENEIGARNLFDMLEENGISSFIAKNLDTENVPIDRLPIISYGINIDGFEIRGAAPFICLCAATDARAKKKKSSPKHYIQDGKKTPTQAILSYADLSVGDYVVHAAYGIGKYLGIERIKNMDGALRDHIRIQYDGTDTLFIPCDQLDMISKYIGAHSDDGTVKLSKMGGEAWTRTKARAKAAAKSMAKELISLYARRQRQKGFACLPDDDMQLEFESTFEFEETKGQLLASQEIKRDMERDIPMDRLLCGDVGFGKTEVAMRAAFKAVMNSKQVAVLVPTTILAAQHFSTFSARMRDYPIKIATISRFSTPAQIQQTLRRLKRGDIDIIIGTHRLLSNDIAFKDLGLLIIDEEQRFGVAHKEKLKQLSTAVDVLTLSATPIPRTLNMALSSIRDFSILDEAPTDRYPVQTYVAEHDDEMLFEAINKELSRGGQVFYIHNHIDSIANCAGKIAKRFPNATVAVAHGRTDKDTLSDIWEKMISGEIDVLVCTTIVETGIDLPNANTLIIENADRMGLSQLHQIRGRVGRSTRRAYAYFTYRPDKMLSEIASKRLSAIRDYTEFGSGFKIALRDIEIRGAGDILGTEQHGHMDNIGYDLYIKILNEAVLEEKGETVEKKEECVIEALLDAYIPEKYIKTVGQRIDVYKKIARISTKEDYDDIFDELFDRYGNIPPQVKNLLDISLLRALATECNFVKITEKSSSFVIYPKVIDFEVWSKISQEYPQRVLITPVSRPYITFKKKNEDKKLEIFMEMLKKFTLISKKQ